MLSLAQVYEQGKRFDDAGKALDDAEKLSASYEEKSAVYFMRGALLERQKKYDASEEAFRKALALNPDDPQALNYLGYMLADRNVWLDEAYKMIQRAVELVPNSGAYLDSLGWVYFRQGKLTDAERILIRAVDPAVNPRNARRDARHIRAKTNIRAADIHRARRKIRGWRLLRFVK